MAGMLPGVEAARRRRFHQSSLNNDASTRRNSLCLYASSNHHELHISSVSSLGRKPRKQDDEKLDPAAREAKKRLDHRLQTHFKSETNRRERSNSVDGRRGSIYKQIMCIDHQSPVVPTEADNGQIFSIIN